MSTDLFTQLAEYGEYHRETQDSIPPSDATQGAVTLIPIPPPARYGVRRLGAVLIAAMLIILVISIPALLRAPEVEDPADSVADTTPIELPDSTATTVALIESPDGDGYTTVHTLDDGSLIALVQMNVWRSEDGETWEEWYTQDHEIDLLSVASDGAVLAVRSPNDPIETPDSGSMVNGTSEVHRYDPATETWTVIDLPRPDAPSLAPQPEDADECELYGFQSWVEGIAIVVGEQIVILGDHRVVADGICDKDFQFLWTSADGLEWNLVPDIGINGFLHGIIWTEHGYVGYGSSVPSYVGPPTPEPQVWTASDLTSWSEPTIDLTALPAGGIVNPWPRIETTVGGLTLTYDVERYRPGLDASMTDLAGLQHWVIDAGWTEGDADELGEVLEGMGVDFPLDEAEIQELTGGLDLREPFGTLTLTSSDGTNWATIYTPA
ncbi:MAG TPA: hypothetical protein VJA46_03245 [Acidimicrobiia bacterium]|nr:hypothetical protein [Acidimicrobiia bacterium]